MHKDSYDENRSPGIWLFGMIIASLVIGAMIAFLQQPKYVDHPATKRIVAISEWVADKTK